MRTPNIARPLATVTNAEHRPSERPGVTKSKSTQTPSDPIYDIPALEAYFGQSKWTIRTWIRTGKLRACKLGDSPNAPLRVRQSDIDAFLVPVVPRSDPTDDDAEDEPDSGPTDRAWLARLRSNPNHDSEPETDT